MKLFFGWISRAGIYKIDMQLELLNFFSKHIFLPANLLNVWIVRP